MNKQAYFNGYTHKSGLDKEAGWKSTPLGHSASATAFGGDLEEHMVSDMKQRYQNILKKYQEKAPQHN